MSKGHLISGEVILHVRRTAELGWQEVEVFDTTVDIREAVASTRACCSFLGEHIDMVIELGVNVASHPVGCRRKLLVDLVGQTSRGVR